ncbi:uncharacterized protein LOC130800138 [Amaranthus tricolor]|uniref:uncharacterized protein LOC130800138 n=1 Tax=Amaranthus tricolor TaxID=29722 RepID=UPI00258AC9C9|nr:uncharacterized protein LOC130800138 [Amaranthus tricolor]
MTARTDQIVSGASFSLSSQSPSFTTFSSENIADVAARVVKELNLSYDDPYDDDFYSDFSYDDAFQDTHQYDTVQKKEEQQEQREDKNSDDEDVESEFEFVVLCGEDNSSPISADEIFSDGKIKPLFPVFNTDLIYGYGYDYQNGSGLDDPPQKIRLPLRKLFEESRNGNGNGTVSCSSSEGDDLEGIPEGTYCVWTPKKKEEVIEMRKKSKSTGNGSSKRWRFRDLLYRSNSDGKDTFVFLTPSNDQNKNENRKANNGNGNGKRKEKIMRVGGNKKKSGCDVEKKKSYLPYRQDLVGFFANVNGISRTVRPF